MRALILNGPGSVALGSIDPPSLKDGQVLLRVAYVGFCGGDLNGFRGLFGLQTYPVVLGHEVGAVVETVASGVPSHICPGDRVTLNPYQSCGQCSACKKGRPNACVDNRTMGVRRPGAITPLIAVPWQSLHSSKTLSLRALALVEPLSVGFHAANRGRMAAGDTTAVIGCGIVGLGVIHSAARKAARVIAVDIDDAKLALARDAGAVATINSAKADLHQALRDLTASGGCDVVVEAVGSPSTFRAAVDEVAFGGRVVYIGYSKKPVEYDAQAFVQKELDILGSRNALGEFAEVIAALEDGGFPIDAVITRTVDLDHAASVLEDWDKAPAAYTKILVDMTKEQI